MLNEKFRSFLPLRFCLFIFLVVLSFAANAQNEAFIFNVDKKFDKFGREKVEALKIHDSPFSEFYAEKELFNLSGSDFINSNIKEVAHEYENNIKPKISNFLEITIPKASFLYSRLEDQVGGYFSPTNVFPKKIFPESNEKNLINLNSKFLGTKKAKSFLAHEFQHLITFLLKESLLGDPDDIWLNELRSEFFSDFLDYDKDFLNSNFASRYQAFLSKSNDSLTEWLNEPSDYGSVNIFAKWLRQNFGNEFFKRLILIKKNGIKAFDDVLASLAINKKFEDIFYDWQLANYLNNLKLNNYYSYQDQNLQNLKISANLNLTLFPALNFTGSFKLKDFEPYIIEVFLSQPSNKDLKISLRSENKIYLGIINFEKSGKLIIESLRKASLSLTTFSKLNNDINKIVLIVFGQSQERYNENSSLNQMTFNLNLSFAEEQRTLRSPLITPDFGYILRENIFRLSGSGLDNITNIKTDFGGKIEIISKNENEIIFKISELYKTGLVNFYSDSNILGTVLFLPNLQDGSLIKDRASQGIYVIKGKYKRPMPKEVLTFYGHLIGARVYELDSFNFGLYQESNLVLKDNDIKVHEIINGKKIWIQTEDEFLNRGYNFEQVFIINEKEFNYYK